MRTPKDETPHERMHVATHVADEPKAARVTHVAHAEEAPVVDDHVVQAPDEPVKEEEKPARLIPRRAALKEPEPVPQNVSPAQIQVGDRLRLPDGNEVTALGVLNTDNELLIQVREGGGWVNASGAAVLS